MVSRISKLMTLVPSSQDAFVENYLTSQRVHVFSHVGVLIYVFDIESREFDRDLVTFSSIMRALSECSPDATVFCLIHKMDLVQDQFRVKLYEERVAVVKERSEKFEVRCYATSIWDQSLYKAWAGIIYTLIPNLGVIEGHLQSLANVIGAEEIVLFERTTFLVVTSVTSDIGKLNPDKARFERLSNIIKTFKQSLAKHTGLPKSSPQFLEVAIKVQKFNLFIARFTANTYILVVTPPGEATFNGAVMNTKIAVAHFEQMDGLGKGAINAGTGEAVGEGNGTGPSDSSKAKSKDDSGKSDAEVSKDHGRKKVSATSRIEKGVDNVNLG